MEKAALPRKGFKCMTVPDKVHEEIRKKAEGTNCTMREYVEYLVAKDKASKEGF
jgi:hypothetical protein